MDKAEGERKFWLLCLELGASQTLCFPFFLSVIPCFPSLFLSLSPTHMSLRAGGLECHRGNPAAQMCCLACSFKQLLRAATPPGPPALMKSCSGSIWLLLIWHGASVHRQPPLSHTECSFETREAARRGNSSLLWPRALRLTLAPKWKTCTAQQVRGDVQTFSSICHPLKN